MKTQKERRSGMDKLVQIVMETENISEEEAQEIVKEAKLAAYDAIASDQLFELEEVMDELGLEMDYIGLLL